MNTQQDLQFGTLAVKNGFASSSEIELALDAQREGPAFESDAPLRLGEILREMGTLTSNQVETLLETQTRLRETHDAPAAPAVTAVDFQEIEAPAFVQESGPSITVNGEPLNAPRTLKSGDRLKAGDLQFRFSGEALEIRPKDAAPAPAVEKPAEAAVAAPPKSGLAEKFLPILRALDGVFARILPALHTQRKYVLAAAFLSWITLILPWRVAANGNTVMGIQGPGWLTALLALVPASLTLFTRSGEPFTRPERIAASAAAGLALLVGILKFLLPPAYATSRGVGLHLSIFAAACLLAAGAFARAGGRGAVADSTTLGARLWKKLSGFLGSVSGRRAKELNAAMEQRDGLLRKIGEAALEAHPALPEAAAAIQAREVLQKAGTEAGAPNAQVKAKAAQKAADAKARRAFVKLAQRALDGGLPLAGQEPAIAELRATEARIKELS
jgi:hypothetical protein